MIHILKGKIRALHKKWFKSFLLLLIEVITSSDNDLFSVETKLKYVLPVFEGCSSSPEHRVTRAERKTRLRGSDDGNTNGILSADHKCR